MISQSKIASLGDQSQKKLLQSSRNRHTPIQNELKRRPNMTKTWVLFGVKNLKMDVEASKAVIQHLDGKNITAYKRADRQLTYKCVDEFKCENGKWVLPISFEDQQNKKIDYQIILFDIPQTRNRVIVLPFPNFGVENGSQMQTQFNLLLDFFVLFLSETTLEVKFSEIENLPEVEIQNLQQSRRQIQNCFNQQLRIHTFGIMTREISEESIKEVLNHKDYQETFAIAEKPINMFRKLQEVFQKDFIVLSQTAVYSKFRISIRRPGGTEADKRQDQKDKRAATKICSDRFKGIQGLGLSAFTPLFKMFEEVLSLIIGTNPDESFADVKKKKDSKFLEEVKYRTFIQLVKACGIDFNQYSRKYQFQDYLKFSQTSEILQSSKIKQSWIRHEELTEIPQQVRMFHFVSEFAKICRLYSERKVVFNGKSCPDQQINHLRECLKALFSLMHEVNFEEYIEDQWRCQNLQAYYNFVENLINQIKAYNGVISPGAAGYTITSLAKTLINTHVCSQKVILNCILHHQLQNDKSVPYYDTIIKIIEDNVNSMSGKQHGEDVFKKKCTFYKMRAMQKRAAYLIKHSKDRQQLYVAIKNLLIVYLNRQQVKQESTLNLLLDFDEIILTIGQLLKKTGNPKLAMIVFKGLHRVIAFQDCMKEYAMTLPDGQQKWKLFYENAEFFFSEHFAQKAKWYYQLVFEQTSDKTRRTQAKQMVKDVEKRRFNKDDDKPEQVKQEGVILDAAWIEQVECLKSEGALWSKNFSYRVKHGNVETKIENLG